MAGIVPTFCAAFQLFLAIAQSLRYTESNGLDGQLSA
jgi:hypothetical protein